MGCKFCMWTTLARTELKFNKISELLTLSFHHGYVVCSGFSQHYKITYPWLLTVNKYHLYKSYNCSMLLLKSVLIRFLYFYFFNGRFQQKMQLWPGWLFKFMPHFILQVATLIISQQAGKKHSIVFQTLPIHLKTKVSTCSCLILLVWLNIMCL